MGTEPKIKGLSILETERIINKATKVVSEVIQNDKNQTGAILAITDWTGSVLFVWLVGELSIRISKDVRSMLWRRRRGWPKTAITKLPRKVVTSV